MDWRPEKAPVRNSAYAGGDSPFLPLPGGREKEKERDGEKKRERERQQK